MSKSFPVSWLPADKVPVLFESKTEWPEIVQLTCVHLQYDPCPSGQDCDCVFKVLDLLKEYPTFFDYLFVVTSTVQEFTSSPPEVEGCGDKGCHHL